MTPLQHRTLTVLSALETVGIPPDEQVQVLTSCLVALCSARARGPAEAHILANVIVDDLHARIDDAWRTMNPVIAVQAARFKG